MVFSLFRRQEKRAAKKARTAVSEAAESTTVQQSGSSDVDRSAANESRAFAARRTRMSAPGGADHAAREAARLTAEKIDQIENEMIADALTGIRPEPARRDDTDDSRVAESAATDSQVTRPDGKTRSVKQRAKTPYGKPSAVELLQQLSDKEIARSQSGSNDNIDTLGFSFKAPGMPGHGDDADRLLAEQQSAGDYSAASDAVIASTIPGLDEALAAPRRGGAQAASVSGSPAPSAASEEDDMAIDILAGSLPEMLEEAAILYANGQQDIAAAVLREAIASDLTDMQKNLAWHMLFDLFRATGAQDQFENLAMDYARQTESSPPSWSDNLVDAKAGHVGDSAASPSRAILGESIDPSVTQLVDQLIRAAGHKRKCSVDFGAVKQIDENGAQELQRLFETFAQTGHPLLATGLDTLLIASLGQTEVGRLDPTQVFWMLAMTCLRIRGEQHRFDDLSIDYCVTFEVSPPPWQAFGGSIQTDTDQAIQTPAMASVPADTLVLSGDVAGKIETEMATLNELVAAQQRVKFDCNNLRRLDFTAAGELLNGLSQIPDGGKKPVFIGPNYLVYALMLVMGISDYAEIRRRRI